MIDLVMGELNTGAADKSNSLYCEQLKKHLPQLVKGAGAGVKRLIIFDLRYTIYAVYRHCERIVNRKSHILNSVNASSPQLLQEKEL
jgi:hypothetical protein